LHFRILVTPSLKDLAMKKLLSPIVLGACMAFGVAHAQTTSPAAASAERVPTAQQNKMAACNKDATGKKGEERKSFMKNCLSASGTPTAAKATPQEKMKTCNVGASDKKLKGDDRKTYMKTCLSTAA
jgi:hypothetical protein